MKWTTRCKELESEKTTALLTGATLATGTSWETVIGFPGDAERSWLPDENLVQDICKGFKLSGWLQRSDFFQQRSRDLPMIWTLRRSLQKG